MAHQGKVAKRKYTQLTISAGRRYIVGRLPLEGEIKYCGPSYNVSGVVRCAINPSPLRMCNKKNTSIKAHMQARGSVKCLSWGEFWFWLTILAPMTHMLVIDSELTWSQRNLSHMYNSQHYTVPRIGLSDGSLKCWRIGLFTEFGKIRFGYGFVLLFLSDLDWIGLIIVNSQQISPDWRDKLGIWTGFTRLLSTLVSTFATETKICLSMRCVIMPLVSHQQRTGHHPPTHGRRWLCDATNTVAIKLNKKQQVRESKKKYWQVYKMCVCFLIQEFNYLVLRCSNVSLRWKYILSLVFYFIRSKRSQKWELEGHWGMKWYFSALMEENVFRPLPFLECRYSKMRQKSKGVCIRPFLWCHFNLAWVGPGACGLPAEAHTQRQPEQWTAENSSGIH